ncbi:MAG TPA: 4Fe-4S dicluster domain-containing protein [Bacteroidales bacterium]|nr:4Fe-4S dicluster domain-containing protein [Bacteroidales bacterium]
MKADFKHDILKSTGVHVDKCYQCGKCSAGCPLAEEMDYPPSYVMRMLQTGNPEFREKVIRSFTIWVCLSCETCYARCPMSIEIPRLMDYMRELSLSEKKTNPKAREIISFHKSFLDSIEKTGRLYEIGLLADYKVRTLKLMQDVQLAPAMFRRGKLNIVPELIRDRKRMSSIFSKTLKKKK